MSDGVETGTLMYAMGRDAREREIGEEKLEVSGSKSYRASGLVPPRGAQWHRELQTRRSVILQGEA